MSSRAAFLASLGINENEMQSPDEPFAQKVAPPPRARRTSGSIIAEEQKPFYSAKATREDSSGLFTAPALGRIPSNKALARPQHRASQECSACPSEPINETVVDTSSSAEEFKLQGNECFKNGDFRKAIRFYTKAIDLDPNNSALYSNRSAAYLQVTKEQIGMDTRSLALRDAEKVVKLRPDWAKGFGRLGDALFKLDRLKEAADAYENALMLEPGNQNLLNSLDAVRQLHTVKRKREGCTGMSPFQSCKSSHELREELYRSYDMESGNDYKQRELERFRSGNSVRKMSSSSLLMRKGEDSSSDYSNGCEGISSVPKCDVDKLAQQAREYQQTLLEAYRKRKLSSSGLK